MLTTGENAQVGNDRFLCRNQFFLWIFSSTAVDFAKSGISAPRLHKDLRVDEYPHYMEKHDKKSRISTTILGQLYDRVKDYNIALNIDVQREISDAARFPFASFTVAGYRDFESEAFATKSEYDRELRRLMRQYGITHEQEVISGYILKFNSRQYAKDGNIFQLKQDITHAYRAIRTKFVLSFAINLSNVFLGFNLDISNCSGGNSTRAKKCLPRKRRKRSVGRRSRKN